MILKSFARIFSIIIIVLVISLSLYFFLPSNLFLNMSGKLAKRFYPSLSYSHLQGNIFQSINVDDLTFKNTSVDITAKNLQLTWQPIDLLYKHLTINHINLNNADIHIAEQKNNSNDSRFSIFIDNINLSNVNIIYSSSTLKNIPKIQIQQANLAFEYSKPKLLFQVKSFSGKINQYPAAITGRIRLDKDFVNFEQVKLSILQNHLLINGGFDKNWHMIWNIQADHLNQISPNIFGEIHSQGKISGELNHPIIQGNINADSLKILGKKDLTIANITGQSNGSSALINVNNLNYGKFTLNQILFNSTGSLSKHQIDFSLKMPNEMISIHAQGKYADNTWLGQLTSGNIFIKNFPSLTLTNPANISVSKTQVTVSNTCFMNQNQKLCLDASYQPNKQTRFNLTGQKISLATFSDIWNNPAVQIQGFVDLASHLNIDNDGNIIQKTNLNFSPGKIDYIQADKTQSISYQQGYLISNTNKNLTSTRFKLMLDQKQYLIGNIDLIGLTNINKDLKNQKIAGQISLNNSSLFWLADLIPQISTPTGDVNANLKLSGTLNKPKYLGEVILTNAQTTVPSIDLTLNNITIRGNSDLSSQVTWQGQVYSGGQALNIKGVTSLNQDGFPTTLNLSGNNILIANTPTYKINASPTIKMIYDHHQLSFDGSVNIENANLNLGDFTGGSLTLPDDVVFVDNLNTIKSKPLDLTAKLKINLGNHVSISTKGFTGQLLGNLLLNYDPNNTTTATGEIQINNGKYSAYGQELNITKGELIFSGGPINNPAIDIQATRSVNYSQSSNLTLGGDFLTPYNYAQPGKILVGVVVTGTANNYQLNLFSQPAIANQSDVLSLLMFGTTTDNLSGASGQLLMSAASQLNLGGSQAFNITQELQNAFGLDQLGITQESIYDPTSKALIQTPSFSIGKQINNRLFLNYSIGISDPISIVTMRYLLTKNLSVQTNASQLGQGFDIFYTVER